MYLHFIHAANPEGSYIIFLITFELNLPSAFWSFQGVFQYYLWLKLETQRLISLGFPGGAIVGTIVGALKGQTTETGFLHGAGIGAVAGAITAVQLLESAADGEPLSKVKWLKLSPLLIITHFLH